MPDDMTFHMGKFPADLPGRFRYAPRNHMWCLPLTPTPLPGGEGSCNAPTPLPGGEGKVCYRFGFTSFAVRLMQDVFFLDWIVSAGDRVHQLQHIGHIETSKAESDLYAPLDGRIIRFNAELLKDPSAINVDKYGAGWLFEMEGEGEGEAGATLDVGQYCQYLADNWDRVQRHIKGKINTED